MSRCASNALLRAITAHIGPLADVTAQQSPWSSATFTGVQHMIWLTAQASEPFEMFARNIGEIDFPMHGHFVADIEIAERHGQRLGIRALTIAEA